MTINTGIRRLECTSNINVVEAHATVANFLSEYLSTSCGNDERRLIVGRFNHKGLHQLHNSFVADEDLRG